MQASFFNLAMNTALESASVSGAATVDETGLYLKMCLEGFGLAQLAERVVSGHLQ